MRHTVTVAFALLLVACGLDTSREPVVPETGPLTLDEEEVAHVRVAIFGVAEELDPLPPYDLRAAKARQLLRDRIDQFGRSEEPSTTPEAILRNRIDQFGRTPRL